MNLFIHTSIRTSLKSYYLLHFFVLQGALRTSGSSCSAQLVQDDIAKLLCVCCSSSKHVGLMQKCCLSQRTELHVFFYKKAGFFGQPGLFLNFWPFWGWNDLKLFLILFWSTVMYKYNKTILWKCSNNSARSQRKIEDKEYKK